MLASTVQFSKYGRGRARPPHTRTAGSSTRTGPPQSACFAPQRSEGGIRPFPQDPTACLGRPPPRFTGPHHRSGSTGRPESVDGQMVNVPPMSNPHGTLVRGGLWTPVIRCQVLLRKEVIQPHLPVRLPCYDFVPIADSTFDGSLPKGLGHRLRVFPTFVT